MQIRDVTLYAVQGGPAPGGKHRPQAFEPYCLIEGLPAIPYDQPYRVVARGSRRLFFREREGFCQFFEHNPRDEHGYGGAVFSGVLEGGQPFSVKGPWSSSCETVNALGLPSAPCAPIAASSPGDYPSWRAMHATLPILEKIAAFLTPDWTLIVPPSREAEEKLWMIGASDEQLRAIEGGQRRIAVPHFVPTRDFEDCPDCEGRGSVKADACDFCAGSGQWPGRPKSRCYRCQGRGYKLDPCPACGRRFCASGIAPYPRLKM